MSTANTSSSDTFQFRLVSPEAELVTEPALSVTIPGSEGEFGVLPGHMCLVATLRPGVVELHTPNNPNPVRYFIAGGFADVGPGQCTVLAEQAIDVLQLDAESLANDVAVLEARLQQGAANDHDVALWTGELALARAKQAALASSK